MMGAAPQSAVAPMPLMRPSIRARVAGAPLWRAMPSPISRVWKAPRQIRLDLLEEPIIVQQEIACFELGPVCPARLGTGAKTSSGA